MAIKTRPAWTRGAAAACLLIAGSFAAAAEPKDAAESFDLRPKPRVGRTAKYDVWTLRDQSSQVSFNGREQTITTRFEVRGVVTWRTDRAGSDGSSTCTMTTDWLTATLTGPDGSTQTCDSRRATGENEQVQRLLKAMAGVPIKIEVGADGSIRSAGGVDAVRKRAGQGLNVPDEADFMESANDLALVPAVPASVATGAAWDAAFSWNHELGRLQYNARYTAAGVEQIAGIPVATVNATAKLKLEPDASKLPQGPGSPRLDIKLVSGSWTSQIMFDLTRRDAVGRNTVLTTRLEVKARMENQSITRIVDETIHSQALRIAEE